MVLSMEAYASAAAKSENAVWAGIGEELRAHQTVNCAVSISHAVCHLLSAAYVPDGRVVRSMICWVFLTPDCLAPTKISLHSSMRTN
jgi:hypothetical protein